MIWCLAFVALLAQEGPSNSFDDFFDDFRAKRDGIRMLQADFVQKTVLPGEVLLSEGSLLYAQPRRIVFHTDEPDRYTLVDGRRGYEYEAEIKQLVIYDMEDNPEADIFFLGFENDTEALRNGFDVSLFDTPGESRGAHGLLVKPKEPESPDAYFVQVSLYLRDKDYLPYRIHIVNDRESEVILEVKNFVVNGAPPPEATQLLLPEGTKIIENDTVVETVGEGGKRVPDPLPFGVPEVPAPQDGLVEVRELPEPETVPGTAP
jgi:outer membrane lipoprotein-sorting protein